MTGRRVAVAGPEGVAAAAADLYAQLRLGGGPWLSFRRGRNAA